VSEDRITLKEGPEGTEGGINVPFTWEPSAFERKLAGEVLSAILTTGREDSKVILNAEEVVSTLVSVAAVFLSVDPALRVPSHRRKTCEAIARLLDKSTMLAQSMDNRQIVPIPAGSNTRQ